MEREANYEELVKAHPEAVAQAVSRLRSSRSKHRGAAPGTLPWKFSWSVRGRANTLAEVLNGTAARQARDRRNMSVQDTVDSVVSNTRMCLCVASYASDPITAPQWYLDDVTSRTRASKDEGARIEALTPEERQVESLAVLDALRGTPGFAKMEVE